eukprot:523212_1
MSGPSNTKYDWIDSLDKDQLIGYLNSINVDTQAGWIQTLKRHQLAGYTKSKAATIFLTNQTNQNNNTNTNGNDKTKNNNKKQKKPSKKRPHMYSIDYNTQYIKYIKEIHQQQIIIIESKEQKK